VIDLAGSGAVHTVGGCAGLVGSILLGPRIGFESGTLEGANEMLCSLGVYILVTGWFAFNFGSVAPLRGEYQHLVMAKVAVNSVVSMSAATCMGAFASRIVLGYYRLGHVLNYSLAGMVSITAACSVVEPWGAFCIGVGGSLVCLGSSRLLKKLRVDDPLDCFPIHGACGIWGLLAPGIFGSRRNIRLSYGLDNDAVETGNQFRNQVLGTVIIVTWTVTLSGVLFGTMKTFGLLRVRETDERRGLDVTKHGTPFRRGFAVLDFTWEQVKAIRAGLRRQQGKSES